MSYAGLKIWSTVRESNPLMTVLQTAAFPFRQRCRGLGRRALHAILTGPWLLMAEEARLELAYPFGRLVSNEVGYQLPNSSWRKRRESNAHASYGASFPTRGACQCPTLP